MRYQTAPRPESRWRELNPSPSAWKADVQATTPHRRDSESIGAIGLLGCERMSGSTDIVSTCGAVVDVERRSHSRSSHGSAELRATVTATAGPATPTIAASTT